ncbi:GNAT family N-acetyltransferase [Hydrogenophaga sp. PAMC20947]|uniref:GNAT family N-acetyltransferase n=1 Tax=Hydrogenophaga sp. PAMC20947 TaxID=2565558 RepID=UPI00144516EE|nr:GNAT family N-acetyltransferase [Hydrogenophaga sp. PAMC20947]
MTSWQVQRLVPAHAAVYQALRLRGLKEHPEAFTSSHEEDLARPLDAAEARLTDSPALPHDAFFGGWRSNQLIGVVGMQGRYRQKERHTATVVGLFVVAEARGLGVGDALMQALLRHARHCSALRQLDLTVTAGNDPARQLYERLGFCVWGVYPDAVCVNGVYADKVHLALPLR